MAERSGIFVTYTADDEMPDCLNCVRCDSNYDCAKFCGAEHGWFGYKRTKKEYTGSEDAE